MANGNLFHGVLGFLLIGAVAWLLAPAGPSDEELKRAQYCQEQAIEMHLGVAQDPESGRYYYSPNKILALKRYEFMAACLPEGYSIQDKMEENVRRLKEQLGISYG